MRLYKYYGDGEWIFTNLQQNQIYYSKIDSVNDPYECITNIKLSKKKIDSLNRDIENGILDDPYFEIDDDEKELMKLVFNNMGYEIGENIALLMRAIFLEEYGLSCFSKRNDSILMWGHYSNGFKGICVEYDIPEILTPRLVEVKYSNKPFTINSDIPSFFMRSRRKLGMLNYFSTKQTDWAYEKEWRIIGQSGKVEQLPVGSIKAVYFGVKASENYRSKVVSSLVNHTGIIFYNMLPVYNSFEVKYEEVEREKACMLIDSYRLESVFSDVFGFLEK